MRFLIGLCASLVLVWTPVAEAKEKLSPYLKVGVVASPAAESAQKTKDALTAAGFEVLGEYSPEGKPAFHVIAYSRKDLQQATVAVKDRGLLAAVLKVGLLEQNGKTTISMVNPEYLFRAYLMKNYETNRAGLEKVAADARQALGTIGNEFAPLGGGLEPRELEHYHYMIGMEYFDDPVSLRKFSSFEEGVQTITRNLSSQKGVTRVFALVDTEAKMAVFGVGLADPKTGEPFFLPVIGEDHIAAMPYELALNGNEATILHGRFRIALHWPTLGMGTFTKIIATPGDIEKTMKGLTAK